MAKNENSGSSAGGSAGIVFLFIIVSIAVVVISPGLMVVSTVTRAANLRLDAGQLWAFSSAVSLAYYITLKFTIEEPAKLYFITCGIITTISLFALFGFHAEWPARIIYNLFHDVH